jgi:outer membrane murein-binding lipoprotein Lpp
MSKKRRFAFLRGGTGLRLAAVVGMAALSAAGWAQNGAGASSGVSSSDALAAAVRELSAQVRELRVTVAAARADSEQARAETRELRREVEDLRAAGRGPVVEEAVVRAGSRGASTPPPQSAKSAPSGGPGSLIDSLRESISFAQHDNGAAQGTENYSSSLAAGDQDQQRKTGRAATLDEEYQLLSGKVDDQYQTKVESASKYRMRISGIVLMNAFSNQGVVDNIDVPTLAYGRPPGDSGGSFGATLRQSELGFEVFGPRVAGARTRADLQLDLAGGFVPEPNGVNSGLMRLRTATMRMDWDKTSIVAGQDGLFFSPNSPTSFASLAEPALSYAGNLWGWVPQIRVEHRFTTGESSNVLVQGGILDPVSGEVPGWSVYRTAGPGEESRQPAYATRIAWTRDISGQSLRLGVGGYYGRQDYGFDRNVDAWAAMADLQIPLGEKFEVSGKFYRGRGLGGLYGGLGQSVLFSGEGTGQSYTEVLGLNTVGGWSQLKYRATTKLEFNAAFGMDNPYAKDLEYFPNPYSYLDASLSKNHAGFVNFIYRPRSDVLFSAEYRRIATDSLNYGNWSAGHLNLSMGVLF